MMAYVYVTVIEMTNANVPDTLPPRGIAATSALAWHDGGYDDDGQLRDNVVEVASWEQEVEEVRVLCTCSC